VQQAADETGYPQAIVGYADFLVPDVRPQLDRLTKYRGMRGLRMQLQWHDNPQYRFATGPDLARDPILQKNVARLADYGWSFDLQVFMGQMAGAAELAASAPKVTFILQHAGMLEDLSPDGWDKWRAGMRMLAAHPNMVSKLSALGTFIHKNDPQHIAAIVRETVGIFGAERCLFGSNFPVEKLWTEYAPLVAAFRAAVEPLGAKAERAALHDTAVRVYRLD
jgi:predicted TIM-barrel fold metal-dependent hydrolase